MENNQDYEKYFFNILEENWLFKPEEFKKTPSLKKEENFEYQLIENILYHECYQDKTYLLGKHQKFYFLAIFNFSPEYSFTTVLKHDSFSALAKKFTEFADFSKIHPHTQPQKFIKSMIFEKKLELTLDDKEIITNTKHKI